MVGLLRGKRGAFDQRTGKQPAQEGIVKACQRGDDGQPVQERKIAAKNENDLETYKQCAGDVPRQLRIKGEPGHGQFDYVVPECAKLVEPMRPKMEPPAQWVGNWLGLVMIVEASQVAPAGVATEFDEAGADHDTKDEPAKEPDDQPGRRAFREGPSIEQWTEKNGQEPGLQKLNFPAVTVPVLADVQVGHVERPEQGQDNGIGVA